MRLSRKNLGQLAALYNLVAWAEDETTTTGEAQNMVLGYRGCGVVQFTNIDRRENTHSNLLVKSPHRIEKRAWRNRGG